MIAEKEILEILKQNLSGKRLKHSIGVSKTAEQMALQYGCAPEKARIAGLIHDCAREKSRTELLGLIEAEGIFLDIETLKVKELLHGPAAVYLCRNQFDIVDEEILSAVRYHTTGRTDMSLIEKIVFLADYIEPGRDFPGIKQLRELASEDLDLALLAAFDSTLEYIISRKGYIHIDTVNSRNYIVQALRNKTGQ